MPVGKPSAIITGFAHLLHPPTPAFGIPVLIAPVILGNRNMDH